MQICAHNKKKIGKSPEGCSLFQVIAHDSEKFQFPFSTKQKNVLNLRSSIEKREGTFLRFTWHSFYCRYLLMMMIMSQDFPENFPQLLFSWINIKTPSMAEKCAVGLDLRLFSQESIVVPRHWKFKWIVMMPSRDLSLWTGDGRQYCNILFAHLPTIYITINNSLNDVVWNIKERALIEFRFYNSPDFFSLTSPEGISYELHDDCFTSSASVRRAFNGINLHNKMKILTNRFLHLMLLYKLLFLLLNIANFSLMDFSSSTKIKLSLQII